MTVAVMKKILILKRKAMTMSMEKMRMNNMMKKIECTFENGRPASAPLLRQDGGRKIFATMPGRGCRGGLARKRGPRSSIFDAG